MPFDWRDYLALAKELQNAGFAGVSQEAIDRCIVSRAYYASYGRALVFARDYQDFKPTAHGEDHSALQRWLIAHRHANLAPLLRELKLIREQCDYDKDLVEDLTDLVERALKYAEIITKQIPMPR